MNGCLNSKILFQIVQFVFSIVTLKGSIKVNVYTMVITETLFLMFKSLEHLQAVLNIDLKFALLPALNHIDQSLKQRGPYVRG